LKKLIFMLMVVGVYTNVNAQANPWVTSPYNFQTHHTTSKTHHITSKTHQTIGTTLNIIGKHQTLSMITKGTAKGMLCQMGQERITILITKETAEDIQDELLRS